MLDKFQSSTTAGFALRFVVIFALLIIPWPGFDKLYTSYFQSLGNYVFHSEEGRADIAFMANPNAETNGLDTRMTMANREMRTPEGKVIHVQNDLDSRSIGWMPTAMTLALVLATPIAPWRRIGALVAGLVLVHAFILFSLQCWVWDNAPTVSLMEFSTFGKTVVESLDYSLLNQIGASFTIPVVIWILVTFRRQDAL